MKEGPSEFQGSVTPERKGVGTPEQAIWECISLARHNCCQVCRQEVTEQPDEVKGVNAEAEDTSAFSATRAKIEYIGVGRVTG